MREENAARRLTPRPWHTDWLVLRHLGRIIALQLQMGNQTGGNSGKRVLDFGCGSKPYLSIVEDLGFSYVGADFSSSEMPIDAAGTVPADDASFDAVLSVQVLEHVRDLDRYLREAWRVLKDNGTLVLSTHGNWLYHPHPEDHRRWTRTGLILDVEAHGFVVQTVEALVGPLATTTVIRLTGFAFMLRRLQLIGHMLANVLAVAMNLRGWLEDRITPASITNDNACIYVIRAVKASV
jgi:SAM-dependent methyltransferase